MKTILTLFLAFIISYSANSQQFLWADAYDVSNCNEVAALATDTEGNVIINGVYDASQTLPYKGNAYILKTDADGALLWTDYIFGSVIIGDMATVGTDILIIGQSTGAFSYRGEPYGQGQYFMFAIMLDADGNYKWHFTDQNKWGDNTNIAVGNTGNIALHIRGQSNLGDWIIIVDPDGNVLKTRQISASHTLVVDMAYFNDRVFINGAFTGQGSIYVDTILIELPPIENASITMGFDENLVAQWLYTDQTINNRDGRIAVDSSGIFVFESIIDSNFTSINSIKKFDFNGGLLIENEVPFFTPNATTYPDMAISPGLIGFFTQNNFGFTSHEVILFDHDLNLIAEKEINGPSHLYSGQIATSGEDFYVAHVYSGTLNFGDELTLPYTGTGKIPYISRLGSPPVTDIKMPALNSVNIHVYPNPASEIITISSPQHIIEEGTFVITDVNGMIVLSGALGINPTSISVRKLSGGIYFMHITLKGGNTIVEKLLIK